MSLHTGWKARACHELAEMKRRGEHIVMVTAYDAPERRGSPTPPASTSSSSATRPRWSSSATTRRVPVTMDEMLHAHARRARGAERPLVVADMPFGSYQVSDEEAVRERHPLREGSGRRRRQARRRGPTAARASRAIVDAGIPVMGHIGLTPQSATLLGGYKAQGRTAEKAQRSCRGRARARGRRLLRDRARGDPGEVAGAHHATRSRSRRSASARAAAATGRCSSGTTCSASTTGTCRAS